MQYFNRCAVLPTLKTTHLFITLPVNFSYKIRPICVKKKKAASLHHEHYPRIFKTLQVLQPDGKFVDQIGVTVKPQAAQAPSLWQSKDTTCTELNAPTGVAVTNDRVVVLDSGNRRVKVYNKQDKTKLLEFGSLGQRKGQFRQPEVITVDPLGFILVGDSGNCRVQVFRPNGQLVRVFGGLGSEPGKYGWISGIHVTKQLDIIISDTKNHSVNFI